MTATLLVSCPDRKGIVASLAQLLYGQGANILDADQHSDEVAGMFFQRIRFDATDLDRAALEVALAPLAAEFGMAYRLVYKETVRRVAIYASKLEHCLYDLLVRHRARELPCEIAMIVSNHAEPASIADHFGVPFHHLAPRDEARHFAILDDARVDLVVLARYMQILSPAFVARYPSRIINIHHSFLPAFVGANPYRQAYEKGVKMIGATSHYVTEELDQGPIIEQATVRCAHGDSIDDLVRKGRDLERHVLAAAVRWHLEDRILVYAGKTVVFD
ncbi:MAG: formyltetrahydrofolate deformylase [Proteobacteria bacterium]|nr:formyltetrahydrofolate deformylase [Pseudomonadota bacterium]